jgi:hypothetical protein
MASMDKKGIKGAARAQSIKNVDVSHRSPAAGNGRRSVRVMPRQAMT